MSLMMIKREVERGKRWMEMKSSTYSELLRLPHRIHHSAEAYYLRARSLIFSLFTVFTLYLLILGWFNLNFFIFEVVFVAG